MRQPPNCPVGLLKTQIIFSMLKSNRDLIARLNKNQAYPEKDRSREDCTDPQADLGFCSLNSQTGAFSNRRTFMFV